MNNDSRVSRRRALAAVAGAAAMVTPFAAKAQRPGPLRLIVPTDASSGLDIVARRAQVELSNALGGQPVVVENHPAAGGTIGTALLARAPADGNTIAVVSNTHLINQSVYPKLPYHALHDVTPITVVGASPLVLLVNPGIGVTDINAFAHYLRANASKVQYASAGNGTLAHLVTELFTKEVGVKIQQVPYKGVSPMLNSVLTGETAFCMGVVVAVAQGFLQSGKLRALAISGENRIAAYPSLPTFKESGFPAADVTSWGAFIGPANLPASEVARLHEAIRKAYTAPAVIDAFAKVQMTMAPTTPQFAKDFFVREYERYTPMIKAAGVQIE